jgi:hypothetical protein
MLLKKSFGMYRGITNSDTHGDPLESFSIMPVCFAHIITSITNTAFTILTKIIDYVSSDSVVSLLSARRLLLTADCWLLFSEHFFQGVSRNMMQASDFTHVWLFAICSQNLSVLRFAALGPRMHDGGFTAVLT